MQILSFSFVFFSFLTSKLQNFFPDYLPEFEQNLSNHVLGKIWKARTFENDVIMTFLKSAFAIFGNF